MRPPAHILAVLALSLAAAGSAGAATTTTEPAPRELWRAYPLRPGHDEASVRLPASSAALRPPASAAAHGPGAADDGGSPSWPLVVAIGALTLLLGLLAGRRARRPQTAAAAPSAERPAATASTPPAAPAPRPAAPPTPAPRPAPPAPRATTPAPRPAPPAPPPEPVALPRIRRFRRVPWPPWSQALWRCEITHHYGVVHADLRLVAHEPGRHRGVEVLRTATHTRPGWGAEPSPTELVNAVHRIGEALLADGWEPVRVGDEDAPQRFFWPLEGDPPLDRLAAHATTDMEDRHGS